MTEQRRILLAFALMALVLIGSQWWLARVAPPEPAAPPDTTAPAPEREPPSVPRPDPDAGRRPAVAGTDPAPEGEGRPPASAAETAANELLAGRPAPPPILVETPLYRATIDPRGGTIRRFELLRYPSFTAPGPVQLVPFEEEFLPRAADLGERRVAIQETVFAPSDSVLRLAAGDPPRELALRYSGAGGEILQTYRFDPGTYVVDYRLEMEPGAEGVLVSGIGPRILSNEKSPRDDYAQLRAVARVDGEILTREAERDGGELLGAGGPVDWAGLRNKYFLAMILAPPDGPALSATTVRGTAGDSLPAYQVAVASPIEGGASAYRVYLGPQEYRRLSTLNEGLDDVSQYGWSWIRWMITPFAKLIVVVMLWLHQFIPSYGLVLIVFGLLVRVVLWPLTSKSFRSIRAMQALQPELQRIRERYKNDPQRMQQETMGLYRERKVNPLGGCLPNLLPMPILFALFFVFQSTIEFRGQPFLWLPDLSQPDPYFILPVFMGLTMVASSKLTTVDPKMAAMTYIMPIVLTFVFLNLAAGLVLYYAFSNVLTFGQQWWLNRGAKAEEAAGA